MEELRFEFWSFPPTRWSAWGKLFQLLALVVLRAKWGYLIIQAARRIKENP